MATDSSHNAPPLRSDARHNRDRILDAARTAFAQRGLDIPMAAIARRAGVGVATLYRRFPTREALIAEVFTAKLGDCAAVIDDALAEPDPWRAFVSVIETVCRMQIADRGFAEAILTVFPDATEFEAIRRHTERGIARIIGRAQEAGALRPEFHRTDLTLVLMANNGIRHESPAVAQAASRRLVGYLLEGFRAGGIGFKPLPPPAPVGLYHVPMPQ